MTPLARAAGFVFDVDGCLVVSDLPGGEEGELLPGAAEVLERVRASGRGLTLFTNASGRIPEEYAAILRGLGLDVADDEVITPPVVAAIHIARTQPEGPVLAFGPVGTSEPLRRRGIRLVSPADAERARFVLIGWDHEFTYPKLEAACRAVWAGAELLVTSQARYFAGRSRRPIIGLSGANSAAVAHVTGVQPTVVGKPSPLALEASAAVLGVQPSELAVVGDDLELELAMGRAAGAFTVLVLTGVTGPEDLDGSPDGVPPDLVLPDVGHLLAHL